MTSIDLTDVLPLLRAADPVDASVDTVDAVRLAGVRRVVDLHRHAAAPTPTRHGARRWRAVAIGLGAVVAAPVALVAVLPGTANRLGLPWVTSAAVLGTEIAARTCDGGGHSSALAPSEASPRLWPADLPAGWSVDTVLANRTDSSTAGCVAPSLVLAEMADDQVVGGIVRVVGPVRRVNQPGDPTRIPDRVAGLAADEIVYPGLGDARFHRWVVTGAPDGEWEVVTLGLSESRAREITDRLTFTATQVSYPDDATVSVRYRRNGPPYPRHTSGGIDWSLTLLDPSGRERQLEVRRDTLRLPLGAREFSPGTRFFELDGHAAMDDPVSARRHVLSIEVLPGVVASATAFGDEADVERLLTSLVDLDPGDPRLVTHALVRTDAG